MFRELPDDIVKSDKIKIKTATNTTIQLDGNLIKIMIKVNKGVIHSKYSEQDQSGIKTLILENRIKIVEGEGQLRILNLGPNNINI